MSRRMLWLEDLGSSRIEASICQTLCLVLLGLGAVHSSEFSKEPNKAKSDTETEKRSKLQMESFPLHQTPTQYMVQHQHQQQRTTPSQRTRYCIPESLFCACLSLDGDCGDEATKSSCGPPNSSDSTPRSVGPSRSTTVEPKPLNQHVLVC